VSEIDQAIAEIAKVVTIHDPGFPIAAREAFRSAGAAVDAAAVDLEAIARRHRSPDHPELVAAGRALKRAEQARRDAGEAFDVAKQKRGAAFTAGVRSRLDHAAPHLVDIVAKLEDAFAPIIAVVEHARRHQLPEPLALREVAGIENGLAAMRRLVNTLTKTASDG
jgi:hypothetical protein